MSGLRVWITDQPSPPAPLASERRKTTLKAASVASAERSERAMKARYEELRRRIDEVLRERNQALSAIEEGEYRFLATGKRPNRPELRDARRLVRAKGIEHQQLIQEAAALRKQIEHDRKFEITTRFERAFINAAKELLPSETFSTLVEQAKARMAGEETHD